MPAFPAGNICGNASGSRECMQVFCCISLVIAFLYVTMLRPQSDWYDERKHGKARGHFAKAWNDRPKMQMLYESLTPHCLWGAIAVYTCCLPLSHKL